MRCLVVEVLSRGDFSQQHLFFILIVVIMVANRDETERLIFNVCVFVVAVLLMREKS